MLFPDMQQAKPAKAKPKEYDRKPDHSTGLLLIRYCGRWVIHVTSWDDNTVSVERIDGSYIDLHCSAAGVITLPNGRRTRSYYH